VQIDPATDAQDAPTAALRRWARETLQPAMGFAGAAASPALEYRAHATLN